MISAYSMKFISRKNFDLVNYVPVRKNKDDCTGLPYSGYYSMGMYFGNLTKGKLICQTFKKASQRASSSACSICNLVII